MVSTSRPIDQIVNAEDEAAQDSPIDLAYEYWENVTTTITPQKMEMIVTLDAFSDASRAEVKSALTSLNVHIDKGTARFLEYVYDCDDPVTLLYNDDFHREWCIKNWCSDLTWLEAFRIEPQRNAIIQLFRVLNHSLNPQYEKLFLAHVDLFPQSPTPMDQEHLHRFMMNMFLRRIIELFQLPS